MDSGNRAAREDDGTAGSGVAPSEPPSRCHLCAATPDDELAVLTWTLDSSGDLWTWICPPCSRDHVRDIEARLAADWW